MLSRRFHHSVVARALALLLALLVACGARPGSIGVRRSASVGANVPFLSPVSVNVKTYGAVGDGVADDRAAITSAIGACPLALPCVVDLPVGTYRVTRNGSNAYALFLTGNVHLRGQGRDETVLQLDFGAASATGTSVAVVEVQGNNTQVSDLTIDGNKVNPTVLAYDSTCEHHSGIFVAGSTHVTISNVRSFHNCGDGIQLYNNTADLTIFNVTTELNNRDGISLTPTVNAASLNGARIIGSYIANNAAQQIDSEPACTGTNFDVTIESSTIDTGTSTSYAVTVAGSSGCQVDHYRLIGNRIRGTVEVIFADDTAIVGNSIEDVQATGAIDLFYTTRKTTIVGNTLKATHNTANLAAVRIISVDTSGTLSSRIVVSGNTIDCTGAPGSIMGIQVDGANDVTITGNTLVGPGLSGGSGVGSGIRLRATDSHDVFRSAIVNGNTIANFGRIGIDVGGSGVTGDKINYAEFANNVFDDTAGTMTKGISLDDGTGALQSFSLMNNRGLGGVSTLVSNTPSGSTTLVAGTTGNTGWVAK